jgi:hypothetical protein
MEPDEDFEQKMIYRCKLTGANGPWTEDRKEHEDFPTLRRATTQLSGRAIKTAGT